MHQKLNKILRHIEHVRENTQLMGFQLIERGEVDFGIKLIKHGLIHDNSKLTGLELSGLTQHDDEVLLQHAIQQHALSNPHHPEYWGGIDKMPDLYLAEMCCDWKARSGELGKDFNEWLLEHAPARFKYNTTDDVHKKIMYYSNLLIETL